MMKTKYFFDTEFLEGTQTDFSKKKLIICISILYLCISILMFLKGTTASILAGSINLVLSILFFYVRNKKKTPPTIDLISIGIVSEDEREYYAISKDFNLKEAWNRYDIKIVNDGRNQIKKYWIRENVLFPIFKELYNKSVDDNNYVKKHFYTAGSGFTYEHLKSLIKWYGKSNEQIKNEIITFTLDPHGINLSTYQSSYEEYISLIQKHPVTKPEFYAYYADYDWVAFCWIFGKMMDLPKPFPMYCKDLKQLLDFKADNYDDRFMNDNESFSWKLEAIKNKSNYPTQENEHNALDDAKWNLKLYKFLKAL